MSVGILLDNGVLVTDPSWQCEADVLRAAHGQLDRDRMPGRLVDLEQLQLTRDHFELRA